VNKLRIKPNIDIISALIRITIGLSVVAWTTAKMVKRPWRDSYLILTVLGAMKVAEGIVRFCPLTQLYEKYQLKCQGCSEQDGHESSRDSMEGLTHGDALPYTQI
jgi:hypothetical protein